MFIFFQKNVIFNAQHPSIALYLIYKYARTRDIIPACDDCCPVFYHKTHDERKNFDFKQKLFATNEQIQRIFYIFAVRHQIKY